MAIDNHFYPLGPLWDTHREDVERLAKLSSSCIFVSGVRHGAYYFLSPEFADIYGYDVPAEGRSADPDFLESRIHPDDRAVFEETLDRLYYEFIFSLPRQEQRDYKHIFEFRVRSRDNSHWVRVISQHQILDFVDPDRALLLGTVDPSPDQSPETAGLRFTLINYKTGEIVPFPTHQSTEGALTRREIEILSLIDRGMYSKEISERLSISVHTVNRHRQNILEKTNADNSREAINYARRMGLLG